MSQRTSHVAKASPKKNTENGPFDTLKIVRLVVAAVLFAVAIIVKLPDLVKYIMFIVAAAVAGYDVALEAVNFVEAGDYFATPIVVFAVAVISFVIGFGVDGSALIILYQIGMMVLDYAEDHTKKSAIEMLQYQDESTAAKVKENVSYPGAGSMDIESTLGYNSGLILKLAMAFAVIYAVVIPLITNIPFTVSIHRALMIILVSTPMSIVTAIPLAGIVGVCFAGQQGIVFNDASAMEAAAEAKVALIDKAGIFTAETPRLLSAASEVLPTKTFMSFASHAAYYSEQPFAKAITAVNDQNYKLDVISNFVDITGFGVDLDIGGAHVTLATKELYVSRGITVPDEGTEGTVTYYMTVASRYVGKIVISNDINKEAAAMIPQLKAAGITKCILLTEDGKDESEHLAEDAGFDSSYCECGTEKKLDVIREADKASHGKAMFIYSAGIESHSEASLDIRVNSKSKYADALVDVDNLNNLPFGLKICGRVKEIVTENAVFAFLVKALLIFLSITGLCSMWFAVFIDLVATIATILNDIRVTSESLVDSFLYKSGK